MAGEYPSYNLVETLLRRSRLPRFWTIIIIAIGLLLLLVLAMSLDGKITNLSEWAFWQNYGDGLFLIVYILSASSFMWRLRIGAIQAFRPLLAMDDDGFDRLAAKASAPNRRWEWVSVLIGVGLATVLGQPWNLGWGPGSLWLSVYLVVTGALMNGLLFWLIYDTLIGTVRIARLSRQDLKFDILLDTELLVPIARWGLGISLAWVGGISLSLVFQTQDTLLRGQTITLYAILVGVTVLAFFLSMWSTHNTVASVKRRELALAKKQLSTASRELRERSIRGRLEGLEGLSATLTSWATYQRLVQDTPTWPFNMNIIRRLIMSIMVPVIVYLGKILSGMGFSS